MAESIYRQSALDRLANPERLDAPLRLVARPSWILLGVSVAIMVAMLVWAVVATAPVKVGAQGVLIGTAGLTEIASEEQGRIDRVLVAAGETVKPGQPVATIIRSDLKRDLDEARARLADAQARFARLSDFYGARATRDAGADAVRLDTIGDSRRALQERARYLESKIGRMRALIDRGFVQKDRMVEVQSELADVRERIANLGESAIRVRIDANTKGGEAGLALLDEQRTIQEQQRLIARLSAQLTEQQIVRATQAGQVTEVKVNGGDVVAPGTAIATIAPGTKGMVALLYVPVAEGKRIEPGMTAEVNPANVERAAYGHIRGTVISVAPLPATAEGMRRVLRNDRVVEQLLAGGAPIEVRVMLDRDAATPSGYRWSASKGPKGRISAGSAVSGEVIVKRQRVIGLLFPAASD